MNKRLLKTAFGIALGMCAVAVPGYCGTITAGISFLGSSPSNSSNDVTVTGNNTLSAFSAVPYNGTMQITTAPDSGDDGKWSVTSSMTMTTVSGGDQFTLTGTIGSCTQVSGQGCGSGANLSGFSFEEQFTVATANVIASGNGSNPLNVNFGSTATNFTDLLLTDLGYQSSAVTSLYSGGAVGPDGTGSGSTYTFSPTSETLDLVVTGNAIVTPEPVSFLLMGVGLLGTAWFARRRTARI
jgi:hypothetical protein